MDVSIKNIYQIWVSPKGKLHFHQLGDVLLESDETLYSPEKHDVLLADKKMTKLFISNKIEFDKDKAIKELSKYDLFDKKQLNKITDMVHEGYMGELIYCVRFE